MTLNCIYVAVIMYTYIPDKCVTKGYPHLYIYSLFVLLYYNICASLRHRDQSVSREHKIGDDGMQTIILHLFLLHSLHAHLSVHCPWPKKIEIMSAVRM